MTFGKLIEDRITRPYTEISEYDYDELNESQRVDITNKTGSNLGIAYLFIILLGFIGFVISHEITSDNRGWVNNITTVKDDLEEQRYLEEKIRWNKENYKKNHTPY